MFGCRVAVLIINGGRVFVRVPFLGDHIDNSGANIPEFRIKPAGLHLHILHGTQADSGNGDVIPFIPQRNTIHNEGNFIAASAADGQATLNTCL